jgi:hypothetical protein
MHVQWTFPPFAFVLPPTYVSLLFLSLVVLSCPILGAVFTNRKSQHYL